MNYQTYRTTKEAKDTAATLRQQGQDAHPICVRWPTNKNANKRGNTWVVRCGWWRYLRTDGQVR